MATYNRAHYIVETLQSIQNQNFTDWECLIIDDGGTDNTLDIIQPILENDKRFQYFIRTDKHKKGLPGCRNYGLDLAKGNYVIFFDDDDIVHPQNLTVSTSHIEKNNVDFCHYAKSPFTTIYPDFIYHTDAYVREIGINDIKDIIIQKIGFASCTVLWKKDCFNNNHFNESLHYAEEWECYCRLMTNNLRGIMIDTILYFNRKHPNSNTGEFYANDPLRRKSYVEAVLLVVKNLKQKGLLTYSLKRYFIGISIKFKEYNLFKNLIDTLEFTTFEKLKWQLFYFVLPLRLKATKIKKAFKNN